MMGPPTRAAELLLLVDGLGEEGRVAAVVQSGPFAVGIEGVEGGIAEVVEEIAVKMRWCRSW